MPLTPSEAITAYNELSRIAASEGLAWLVEDVERAIAMGRQSLQKIKPEAVTEERYVAKRAGPPADFVVVQQYSEQEKLRLLVDAIEAASCGLSFAVAEIFGNLSSGQSQPMSSLAFAADAEQGKIFPIDRSFLNQRELAERLHKLLQELKDEI